MPLSYTTHTVASTASGSGLQFSVNYPYILRSHVKVYYGRDILAGTHTSLLVDGNDYNWTTDTQITLTAAPSSTSTLTIIRETPTDAQQVVWQDGSNLIADDLNTADRQNLYVVQEQQDRNSLGATEARNATTASNAATAAVSTALVADGTRAMTGNLNANSNKVVNLANPTAGGDAVNKTFADATYQPLDAELTELATMAGNTAAALADLTQAEVNILDGATVSTSELNTLDGITASTAELNKLDGVTSSTAELNILDGVTATAAEINALDGITASVDELNKLDGVTATTAELNFVDGVTSGIQAQLDAKQPLDAELTELATMQSGTASALADLTQAEVQILDGATVGTAELNTLDGITSTTTELNVLDGVTATTTELNVTDGLTASTSELNQLDGKTISSTLTPANTNDIPTSSAVNTFVSGLLNALGGFVAIPNETSFPTTNPDPSDNAGTVVSIADAGGVVVDASGVSTTGRTTGNATVTINGFPSSLQSTTLGAGLGLQVQTTSTLNTYTYHKLIAKETDITQLSDDINDFNARYRVSDNAPTTDLDEGDLWYDKTANKMKVYDTSTSAWKEVQSVGNFFINTLSSSSGTGGGSATFNGSAYRFTLSNAGANAQQMLVSVNGVIQKPNSGTSQPSEGFAIENNDIIFAAAPASGANHFIVTLGSTVNIGQPSNNTVDTSELVDGAVTNAKVSSSAAIASSKINFNNIAVTGSVTCDQLLASDNDKIQLGDAQDFRIYHDGSTNIIDGHYHPIELKHQSEVHVKCVDDGAVELYHNNNKKLETKSDGIDVTGELQCDSLDVDGNAYVSGRVGIGTSTINTFAKLDVDSGSLPIVANFNTTNTGGGAAYFKHSGVNKMTVGTAGSAALSGSSVDDGLIRTEANLIVATGGNSEKMRINSDGRLMLGTTTPATNAEFTIRAGSPQLSLYATPGNASRITLGDTDDHNIGEISYDNSDNSLNFATNAATRVTIDSSGRVGIGTSSFNDSRERLRVEAPNGETGTYLTIKSPSTSGTSALFFGDDDFNEGRIQYDHSNNAMRFFTNDGERARILSSGGITFNGDTAQANALEDYEEGTWTPTIKQDGTGTEWNTISNQKGTYTKIGRLVTVTFSFEYSARASNVAQSNYGFITGLPFTNTTTNANDGLGNLAILQSGGSSTPYHVNLNTSQGNTLVVYGNQDSASPGPMRTSEWPNAACTVSGIFVYNA